MVVSVSVMGAGVVVVTIWVVRRVRGRKRVQANSDAPPSAITKAEQQAAAATNIMPLEPILLGPYELKRMLGRGAMATVYQARDTRDDRILAIKVVSQEHRQNRDFRRRFQREVELSQPLRHPNLVAVYEAVKLEEDLFMTMEWVDGVMLEDLLANGPLPLESFPALAVQMLAGLHFAHKRHLFHRDIKPANIMVNQAGEAKILDFGLAIEEGQARFTNMGFSMGTPSHMAPEMLTKGISNAHTDQYALGVTFYQMLTGRCPFQASNPMELGLMHVQATPPPPITLRSEIPITWQQIILKMLAKTPDQRYNDLAQIQTLITQSS
ncbi:serine/threonine protein kinase [bacterium]|nr:serine/threonine protein kinase [bacterium]